MSSTLERTPQRRQTALYFSNRTDTIQSMSPLFRFVVACLAMCALPHVAAANTCSPPTASTVGGEGKRVPGGCPVGVVVPTDEFPQWEPSLGVSATVEDLGEVEGIETRQPCSGPSRRSTVMYRHFVITPSADWPSDSVEVRFGAAQTTWIRGGGEGSCPATTPSESDVASYCSPQIQDCDYGGGGDGCSSGGGSLPIVLSVLLLILGVSRLRG